MTQDIPNLRHLRAFREVARHERPQCDHLPPQTIEVRGCGLGGGGGLGLRRLRRGFPRPRTGDPQHEEHEEHGRAATPNGCRPEARTERRPRFATLVGY